MTPALRIERPLESFLALPPALRSRVWDLVETRRNMEGFVSRVAMPDFRWNWHHRVLADDLTRVANGEITRYMCFMPPRHAKTLFCSTFFPAFVLGRDPGAQIISAAYAASQARTYNRSTQRVMMTEEYRAAFPGTALNSRNVRTILKGQGGVEVDALRNADEFEIVGSKGYYKSAGILGGVTGRGANFIIIDDPIKGRAAANSPVIRRGVWDEYTASFYSRLENYRGCDGRIILLLTRWHEDDLAGQLIDQEGRVEDGGVWFVRRFPAILDEEPGPDDPREPGEALWPSKRSAAQWATMQKLSPLDYESLGQQRPRRQGGGIFPGTAFEWYGGAAPPTIRQRMEAAQ